MKAECRDRVIATLVQRALTSSVDRLRVKSLDSHSCLSPACVTVPVKSRRNRHTRKSFAHTRDVAQRQQSSTRSAPKRLKVQSPTKFSNKILNGAQARLNRPWKLSSRFQLDKYKKYTTTAVDGPQLQHNSQEDSRKAQQGRRCLLVEF